MTGATPECRVRFSALQRAENSSIAGAPSLGAALIEFQCSSASRKFLNRTRCIWTTSRLTFQCSSASRKFLNRRVGNRRPSGVMFQCSSASRKFLNSDQARPTSTQHHSFSALQRAENSSIMWRLRVWFRDISFQCSSASRKFLNEFRFSAPSGKT